MVYSRDQLLMKQDEPRIYLETISEETLDFVVNIKSNPDLWPYEEDSESDKEKVKKTVLERMNSDWYKQYIIYLNHEDKTPIGTFHIHHYVYNRKSWEIGYCLLPEYQHQGYAFEAVEKMLKYAFEDLGAHRIVAMCNVHNISSSRLMERLGMVREAVFREEYQWKGKWIDQLFYGILDKEYYKIHQLE